MSCNGFSGRKDRLGLIVGKYPASSRTAIYHRAALKRAAKKEGSRMDYAKMIKSRIRILVFLSCLAVALVFGLSYYFGLISTESAITSRVPELAGLVDQFRSTLLVNTLIFAGIILASFFLLTVLVTDRMFKPLASLHIDMDLLSRGQLPDCDRDQEQGPFGALDASFRSACKRIETNTQSLVADLEKMLDDSGVGEEHDGKLRDLIEKSKQFLGEIEPSENAKSIDEEDESLFMQPV
jgi:hypothetical protein